MMPRPNALFFILCLCIASTSKVTSQSSNEALIPFLQENQYGYSNWNGDLIIPIQYDEAELFDKSFNYAVVKQNEKWYIINNHGEKLKDFVYDCEPDIVIPFEDNNNKPKTWTPQDSSLLSKSFRIIKPANSCEGEGKDIYAFSLRNFKAKNITRTDHYNTNRGYHRSTFSHNMMIAYEKVNKGYTLYDNHLDSILYSKSSPHFLNEHLVYYQNENTAYVYDLRTKKSTKTPFKYIGHFVNNKYLLVYTGSRYTFSSMHKNKTRNDHRKGSMHYKYKYGLCDLDYNLLIDTVYTNLQVFENNHIIGLGDKYHDLYAPKGEVTVSKAKKIIKVENQNTYIVTDTLGKASLYNGDGKAFDNQKFDKLKYNPYTKRHEFQKGNIGGILDTNLNVLFQYPCDDLFQRNHPDYFVFKLNGKQGLLDKEGNEVIPAQYTRILIDEGFVRLMTPRHTGLANLQGKMLIDTTYTRIDVEKLNPEAYDYKDNVWIKINNKGQMAYLDANLDTLLSFHQNTFLKPPDKNEKKELKQSAIFIYMESEINKLIGGLLPKKIKIDSSYVKKPNNIDVEEQLRCQATAIQFIDIFKTHLDQNALIIVGDFRGRNHAYKFDASPIKDDSNRIVNILEVNDHKRLLTYEVDGKIGTANYAGEIQITENKPLDIPPGPSIQHTGSPMKEGRRLANFVRKNYTNHHINRYPQSKDLFASTKKKERTCICNMNSSCGSPVQNDSKNKLPISGEKLLVLNQGDFEITDMDGKTLLTFKGLKATRINIYERELIEVVEDNWKKYYIDPYKIKTYKN